MKKTAQTATLFLPLLLAVALPSPGAAGPALEFHSNVDMVGANGVTSGGDVLFFSDSHERQDWTRRVVSRLDLAQADSKGVAILSGVSVVDPSIWAAVDLSTGGFDVASPSGQYQAAAVQEAELVTGADFVWAGERLDLVVIRGGHAWHARAHDGGGSDRGSAQDGQVAIAFDALEKVYPSVGFAVYGTPKDGDVLIGIDADQMVYFTMTVTENGEPGK
jgi:hypothetical protein